MNKFVYGLFSCCIIACSERTESGKDEDPNVSIVKKVFNEDPLAIGLSNQEKNHEVIDNFQQCIANHIKNQNTFISENEKYSLAKMLVHFITKNYNPKTSPQTIKDISKKINEFYTITQKRYSNVFSKVSKINTLDIKKKIVLAYYINDFYCTTNNQNKLPDEELITKLQTITITNDTPDVEIFNKVRAILSPRI